MNTSKVISRRSNLVLISVLITIIIIVFSTVSFLYVVNDIQKLTNFINSTGSIRGGIQRVTKLYLLNQDIKESPAFNDEVQEGRGLNPSPVATKTCIVCLPQQQNAGASPWIGIAQKSRKSTYIYRLQNGKKYPLD